MKKDDELSLENLSMPACFSDPKALAEIPRIDPDGHLSADAVDTSAICTYDVGMKMVNTHIYDGYVVSGTGTIVPKLRRLQFERMKFLFGLPDDAACYTWLSSHRPHDGVVRDALLDDALRTGKCEELPDALQDEYRIRKEAGS